MNRRGALAQLQKATIDTGAGGLLSNEQSKAFIEDVTDRSVFGSKIDVIRRRSSSGTIDKLGVGSRLLRGRAENSDDGYRAGISTDDVPYTAKGVKLPFEITADWGHENIEGESAKAKVVAQMNAQFGQDLDDLRINGDEAAGAGADQDFLKINNGILKLCSTETGVHRVKASDLDYPGTDVFGKELFFAALRALPNRYANSAGLRWIASPNFITHWLEYLSDRGTGAGDAALLGQGGRAPAGIPFLEGQEGGRPGVPYMPDDRLILADPKVFASVITWDIRKYKVTPETDWELATREKEGHVFFFNEDIVIKETDAVVDCHTITFAP